MGFEETGNAEVRGNKVGEVGKLGADADAVQFDAGRHRPLDSAGFWSGTEPDFRAGAGEGTNPHNMLEREPDLELRKPDIATDAEVIVAQRHLHRDVPLAEDPKDVAGILGDGAEQA